MDSVEAVNKKKLSMKWTKEHDKELLKEMLMEQAWPILEEKYRRKMREEINASGISPEADEIDQLLEEIIALFDSNEEVREKEKGIAEDIRLKALETVGETKRRKSETTSDSESEQSENCQTGKRGK
ncbi:Hypothetical predicted protein [Paramuricea clavata]|uniref:Uncharacterized protein n=1 Tax=Paramuricea clavata TaxID=317549 RepID=A0A7D9IU67_PARCT|nr:Hypothetical predicted protein [Paramuricea clavata]